MVQNLNFDVYYTGIGDNKIDHKYNPVEFICLINEISDMLNNFNKMGSKVPILNPNYFTKSEFENLIDWTGGVIIQEF
jgi:hypothetical protein